MNRLSQVPAKDPFYIQWHITNFCNLRCKHCYQDDFSKRKDLDRTGLIAVSDNILAALKSWDRTACVHLTGGEPLLKPELFDLLDYLNRQPAIEELGIITNGLPLHKEMVRRLSAFPRLKKIKVSLDGSDAQTRESIRPRWTFEKVIHALSLLKGAQRFEIILMFTAMKRNYRNLPSLLTLCQDLRIDGFILERFVPWGKGKKIEEEVLNKDQWKEVVKTLLDFISPDAEESPFFPYQAFQVQFDGEEPELLGAPCVVGMDGLCIMPEGEVFPCRRFPVSIGNLLSKPLKEIWDESKILKELRNKENLKGKCRDCDIEECRGCRSLALSLTGDYLEEDPHCPYVNP